MRDRRMSIRKAIGESHLSKYQKRLRYVRRDTRASEFASTNLFTICFCISLSPSVFLSLVSFCSLLPFTPPSVPPFCFLSFLHLFGI